MYANDVIKLLVRYEPVVNKRDTLAYAPIEDSDQPARTRSLTRVFKGRSMFTCSGGSNIP